MSIEEYITEVGRATCVHGVPEEVVAVLFAYFSRSKGSLRTRLEAMIEGGACPKPTEMVATTDRAKAFHESTTLGYGHKSVADHAAVHFAVEGVSILLEREFLSARLLAATSKSTRYVDFRDVGHIVPPSITDQLLPDYEDHVSRLLDTYERLIPPATSAIRRLVPYDDDAKEIWTEEAAWANATSKRALDMVRDLLPACMKTSFGVTMSATGLREFLDKRWTDGRWMEVIDVAGEVRRACRSAMPTLLPAEPRRVPRKMPMGKPSQLRFDSTTGNMSRIRMLQRPNWPIVERVSGIDRRALIDRWSDRGHHMVPDRTAELPEYIFEVILPWAIWRDLGRHRMMTAIDRPPMLDMGFGSDPLLRSKPIIELEMVAAAHSEELAAAGRRIATMISLGLSPNDAAYMMPLATMVPVHWKVNLRELIHVIGLRTVPQGHAGYRELIQALAALISRQDPFLKKFIVGDVANMDDVIVGRPG